MECHLRFLGFFVIVTEVAMEVAVRVILIRLVEVAIEVICGRLWSSLTAFEVIIGASPRSSGVAIGSSSGS